MAGQVGGTNAGGDSGARPGKQTRCKMCDQADVDQAYPVVFDQGIEKGIKPSYGIGTFQGHLYLPIEASLLQGDHQPARNAKR